MASVTLPNGGIKNNAGEFDEKVRTTQESINATATSRALYAVGQKFYDASRDTWYECTELRGDLWRFTDLRVKSLLESRGTKVVTGVSTFGNGLDPYNGQRLFVDAYLNGFDIGTEGAERYYGVSLIDFNQNRMSVYEVDEDGAYLDPSDPERVDCYEINETNNLHTFRGRNNAKSVEIICDLTGFDGTEVYTAIPSVRFTNEVYGRRTEKRLNTNVIQELIADKNVNEGVSFDDESTATLINLTGTRSNQRLISGSGYIADTDYDVFGYPVIAGQQIRVVGQLDKFCYSNFTNAFSVGGTYFEGNAIVNESIDIVDIDVLLTVPVDATWLMLSVNKTLPFTVTLIDNIRLVGNKDKSGKPAVFKPDVLDTDFVAIIDGVQADADATDGVKYEEIGLPVVIPLLRDRDDQRLTTPSAYTVDADYDIQFYEAVEGQQIKIVGQVDKPCFAIFSTSTSSIGGPYYLSTIYEATEEALTDIDVTAIAPAGTAAVVISNAKLLDQVVYDFSGVYKVGNKDKASEAVVFKPDVLDADLLALFDSPKVYLETIQPDEIYCTCNDVDPNKNYTVAMYVDHMMNLSAKKIAKFKSTDSDKLPRFYGEISDDGTIFNNGNDIDTEAIHDTIIGETVINKDVMITKKSVLNSAVSGIGIRSLVIGDSVVNGTGANFPTAVTGADNPTAFWSYMAKMAIEDKADNGGGFDFVSIGLRSSRTIKVNGSDHKIWAEGRGGWKVEDYLFLLDNTEGAPGAYWNPFYTEKTWINPDLNTITYENGTVSKTGVKFSIQSYLDKYKTLADDGVTRLVAGDTAGTEVVDVNANDVCTPNVITISLGFNDTQANYELYIDYMVASIREEFPTTPIVINLLDAAGTYYPELYPTVSSDGSNMLGDALHAKMYAMLAKGQSLHDESGKVFFCPNYFIQPTGFGVTTRPSNLPEGITGAGFEFNIETGSGSNYHPSTFAHASWGYQLLSLIKYILLS